MSLIERGRRQPSLAVLERIASVLDIPMPLLIALASGEMNMAEPIGRWLIQALASTA